jgi:hypothetical protein
MSVPGPHVEIRIVPKGVGPFDDANHIVDTVTYTEEEMQKAHMVIGANGQSKGLDRLVAATVALSSTFAEQPSVHFRLDTYGTMGFNPANIFSITATDLRPKEG